MESVNADSSFMQLSELAGASTSTVSVSVVEPSPVPSFASKFIRDGQNRLDEVDHLPPSLERTSTVGEVDVSSSTMAFGGTGMSTKGDLVTQIRRITRKNKEAQSRHDYEDEIQHLEG
jgi:predicted subunit of tRNA(5-methylaminomethyl-2-thiouridylate) methyltransferase